MSTARGRIAYDNFSVINGFFQQARNLCGILVGDTESFSQCGIGHLTVSDVTKTGMQIAYMDTIRPAQFFEVFVSKEGRVLLITLKFCLDVN